ncbi:Penicillin-binding protein 4*, partial [Globisporangium splendens]
MKEALPLLQESVPPSATSMTPSATTMALQRRKRRIGRATCSFAAALLVTLVLMLVSWSSTQTASPTELESIMDEYRTNGFSGVVRVSHNGEGKFSDWMGLANEEFEVPMAKHSIFPIGSNSKIFTAVAMYQLQERGLVNLSAPVNEYLGHADFVAFGFANQTQWCPRVAQAAPSSAGCESVTFVNLLTMGSGIDDSAVNDVAYYKGSIAKHVGAFINEPLVFQPGTNYSYTHANYVLLSYMIEKLSGQQLDAYLSKQIFQPIGLKKTYYDPYSGGRYVHKGFVNQYVDFYTQPRAAVTTVAVQQKKEYLSTGTCSPDANSGALSGAGGIHSTMKDMHRVYKDLFHNRGRESKVLSEVSILSMVQTRNPVRPSYAQGIEVAFDEADVAREWPSTISSCGQMKCVVTCLAMQMPNTGSSVIAGAFTNHIEYIFPTWDAFEQWQPNQLWVASPTGSPSNGALTHDFDQGDYQIGGLSWALLDAFLRYTKVSEN